MSFDPLSGAFVLLFALDARVAAASPTVIFLNQQLHYADGFDVLVHPAGALQWSQPEPNCLYFTQPAVADGTNITLIVSPSSARARTDELASESKS